MSTTTLSSPPRHESLLNLRTFPQPFGYGVAFVTTGAVTVVSAVIERAAHVPNISLLYLPAILVTAVAFGTWPSLLAAALSVAQYDFFLLRPLFTLTIARAEDALAFVIFAIVAVLTSQLAAGARHRTHAAEQRATELEALYSLGQTLMRARDVDAVLQAITKEIVDFFDVDHCAILVPGEGQRLSRVAETEKRVSRTRAIAATAEWVFRQGKEVALPSMHAVELAAQSVFVPLRAADVVVGVLEVGCKRNGGLLDERERRFLISLSAQAALVIERARAEQERERLRALEESDRVKTTLLSAVSHDLRTPLASIKTSATSLLLSDAEWTPSQTRELVEAIDHEADRLNRLVSNLLDLSRIEAGVLHPILEWYDPVEVMETLVPQVRSVLGDHQLELDMQPAIPAVQLDLVRIEELVVNLVANAAQYAPAGSPIALRLQYDNDGVALSVIDHGPGIPLVDRAHVFERFYRAEKMGDRRTNAGLGLAIARGIAEAHGGSLAILDTPGGGATCTFTLPNSLVGPPDGGVAP
jgi:two-component system, OmpR family, sensor histidine kinase KdpD